MTDANAGEAAVDESADDRLVLSHFTLPRSLPLDERLGAAAAAGCLGVGLFAGEWARLLGEGWTPGRLRDLLDQHGLVLDQVEALAGWGRADPGDAYDEFERLVWTMVVEFDVPYVQSIGPYEGSLTDGAERFGALCDRAAHHGATVGLEFLPFTNVADADHARAVVEAADRPNGGVCVDVWHHARGARDLEMLRRIPPELLVRAQMSDGPTDPTVDDYKDDCLRFRVPPGAGAFAIDPVVEIVLDAVDACGRRPTWDLEVPNELANTGSVDDRRRHVVACADGLRTTIDRVRRARRR